MNRGFRPFASITLLCAFPVLAQSPPAGPGLWLKGNVHTHTSRSDGDAPPEDVIRWYRDHGYGFLALSDHDQLTDPAPLAPAAGLVLVAAEEITGIALPADGRRLPVHVNALGVRAAVEPFKGGTPAAALRENVDRARAAGALALVNHPNFGWALSVEDLLAAAPRFQLLEIFSGHPLVHHQGGGGTPSAEQAWDALLTAGHRIHGAAVDDSHHFVGECTPDRACPGRGWIVARVAEATPAAVVAALEQGDFYASNGVALRDVWRDADGLRLEVEPQKSFRYRIELIGDGGRLLDAVDGLAAGWRFSGNERYVRARVTDSMGRRAWTQAAFARP
jgi:hypothetical protein